MELVPRSIEVLREILNSEAATNKDKLKAVELIFDRVYGRPYQAVKLEEIDTTVHIIDEDPGGGEYNA